MRRRNIPSIIMLIAGMITCIISIVKQYEINYFITLLIVVLIVFYIIGITVKVLLDKILIEKKEPFVEIEEMDGFEEDALQSEEMN